MQISHAILIGSVVIALAIIFERPITQPIVERTSTIEEIGFLGCMNEACVFKGRLKGEPTVTLLTAGGEAEIQFPKNREPATVTLRKFVRARQ